MSYLNNRSRSYNVRRYLKKYLKEYLPQTLRYLAYPSLALALLISLDVLLPSKAGDTFVVTRMVKEVESTTGNGTLLYTFTPMERPTDLVVYARQISGEEKWYLQRFNVHDSIAKRIEPKDTIKTRITPLLESNISVGRLEGGQVTARSLNWPFFVLQILFLLLPGLSLIWPSLLENEAEGILKVLSNGGELQLLVGGAELYALGYWFYLLSEHFLV